MREDDRIDQSVTVRFFRAEFVLCWAWAAWGAMWIMAFESSGSAVAVALGLFIVLRTAFLTTLETPEPRYVLVCFPAMLALAGQLFAVRQCSSRGAS